MPPAAAEAQPGNSSPAALDLDAMREAAVEALSAAGHTTAATLLDAGAWAETPQGVRVEVGAKKTMLGLTVNAEAEKIIKAAVRPHAGQPARPVLCVPGEGGVSPAAKSAARPAGTGSVQARAMENPLVRQAQELFGAEVRSVVDLRDTSGAGKAKRG